MARLLIVAHTPSPAVQELLEAARSGATLPELDMVSVQTEPALSATASDVLAADAVLLITPVNIGYMSGALKHFFDTIYYPCLEARRGMPYGLIVHGNNDTGGAVRSVAKIADALGWQLGGPVVEVVGAPGRDDVTRSADLGSLLTALAADQ